MDERVRIPLGLRLMASFCRACLGCVAARLWPNSAFARRFEKVQNRCPFCKAHAKVRQILIQAGPEQPLPVKVAQSGK